MRERNGNFLQTVKSAEQSVSSGLGRGEWEDAIGGATPDPRAPQTGRFLGPDIVKRLAPLFRTEVDRHTIEIFPDPETHIEAAIDRGRIVAPGTVASEPISEVELELKSGGTASLYAVALDLLAVAPVRLGRRSKAERGYRLAASPTAAPMAIHALPVKLDAAASGDAALRRIGLACLDQLLRNEPGVIAGLAEAIHQTRVAARRLRAILSAFGKMLPAEQRRWASAELRWLADALGAARNLDVFEAALLGPAGQALAAKDDLGRLADAAGRRRDVAYAEAINAIRTRRYTGLLLRLLRWFDGCGWRDGSAAAMRQPVAVAAAGVLDRRLRAARRRSKGFADQSPPERHRLRIALKKLRYAAEPLASLYDAGATEAFIKHLKRLQDDLGDANDVRVGRDIVTALAKAAGGVPADAAAIANAGKRMLDWHQNRVAEREPRVRRHLDQLLDAEPFWTR